MTAIATRSPDDARGPGQSEALFDEAILHFDPWCGDESDVTTLSDRMVVTRVKSVCAICFNNILPKDRVRTKVEKMDGKVKTFRFCVDCCAAMVRRRFATTPEQEMEIENRYDLGNLRANPVEAQ